MSKTMSITLVWLMLEAFTNYVAGDEIELRKQILNSSVYSPLVVPQNGSNPVVVTLTWTTGSVTGLNEKEMKFTIAGVVDATWTDNLLQWDEQQYGVSSIVVKGSEIWTPSLNVLNRMESTFLQHGFENDLLRVYSTGVVYATHNGELSILCNLDPKQFPFDCQGCSILFALSIHLSNEVLLQFSPNPLKSVGNPNIPMDHQLWLISDFSTYSTVYGTTSVATIGFNMYRKPLYYTFTLIGPSSLLNFLTLLAFFIPNDEGEKISCGMTIFLSFVVFLVQVGDIIPENSNAIPVIGIYYLLSMLASALMICNAVVYSFMAKRQQSADKMDGEMHEIAGGKVKFYSLVWKKMKLNGLKMFNVACFVTSFTLLVTSGGILLHTSNNVVC